MGEELRYFVGNAEAQRTLSTKNLLRKQAFTMLLGGAAPGRHETVEPLGNKERSGPPKKLTLRLARRIFPVQLGGSTAESFLVRVRRTPSAKSTEDCGEFCLQLRSLEAGRSVSD